MVNLTPTYFLKIQKSRSYRAAFLKVVPLGGLEPPRPKATDFDIFMDYIITLKIRGWTLFHKAINTLLLPVIKLHRCRSGSL